MSILVAAALIITAGQNLSCPPTHVWDGDGSYRPNQPCPAANAEEARDVLVALRACRHDLAERDTMADART